MRSRRHRGCRGGGRRKRAKQDLESTSEHSGRSPSPASPSPSRRHQASPEVCYINRTLDTDQKEATYEYLAVLIQITGTRPVVKLQQARQAIASKYGIPMDEQLEIHTAALPYDFFLVVPDHESYLTMLNGDRTVQTPAFSLSIRPWHHLVYADHGALYHRVQIEIEGIPPHVWETTMASALLSPYCSMISIHPETRARRDLAVFMLMTWTTHPELIQEAKILAVPEPLDSENM